MQLSPQQLMIPLLISFSLTGAGVLILYFLNKKENDDEKNIENKVNQNIIEIKVPRQFVPLVIGRGGSVISSIQKSTGTNISFKEEHVDVLERTCIVVGKLEGIKLAEERIQCILNNQLLIETYETWIPQQSIIKLTERGGKILQQIQISSNAKIILENPSVMAPPDAKKRVIIKGTSEQIANALCQIEDMVREDNKTRDKARTSSLNRVPRIKTSPLSSSVNIFKDININKMLGMPNLTKDNSIKDENESIMEVFVCGLINPSQFYVQVVGSKVDSLDKLITEMSAYYNNEENREIHILRDVKEGQIVAAKYPADKKWHRAEILKFDESTKLYDVLFVDFGDHNLVSEADILELRTDFLSLRQQAIECSLANVKPLDGKWNDEANSVFESLSGMDKWEPRYMNIKGYKKRAVGCESSRRESSPIPCVQLFKKSDHLCINVGEVLVERELAIAEIESWSATSSALPLNSRSSDGQERLLLSSPEHKTNVAASSSIIEEIDLTLTPSPNKSQKKFEVVDLATPPSYSKNVISCNLVENDRSHETTLKSNLFNKNKSPKKIPFGRSQRTVIRNIVPAGYESELSDEERGYCGFDYF